MPSPSWRWGAWRQGSFLNTEGTSGCRRKFLSFCCCISQSCPSFGGEGFLSVILFFFPSADPDSQLYDMGYTPEEEAPACPDEFDDFVTFEASTNAANTRGHQLCAAGGSSWSSSPCRGLGILTLGRDETFQLWAMAQRICTKHLVLFNLKVVSKRKPACS